MNVTQTPTVFVVDGDAAARREMESVIRSAGWLSRTCACAEEFLARPRTTAASCLIVEPRLRGMSGLELQKRVGDRIEMPIIFASGNHIDVKMIVQAMKAGAFEFLVKPLARDVLLDAMNRAIQHSHAALRQLALLRGLHSRYEALSRREREVMTLVVAGRLNKQVGGELGISEITVKAHRGNLMRKMQAGSFAELVNMALRLPTFTPQETSAPARRLESPWS